MDRQVDRHGKKIGSVGGPTGYENIFWIGTGSVKKKTLVTTYIFFKPQLFQIEPLTEPLNF